MIRGKGTQTQEKQILSQTELDGLKEQKQDLESTLRESEGYGSGTGRSVDPTPIKREIAKIDQAIEDGSVPKVTGASKDSLVRELRDLEDRFKQGLPTKYEMDHPAKCPGAVRKHMSWLIRNEKPGYIARWQQIQRIVNPGQEISIESLRKEK